MGCAAALPLTSPAGVLVLAQGPQPGVWVHRAGRKVTQVVYLGTLAQGSLACLGSLSREFSALTLSLLLAFVPSPPWPPSFLSAVHTGAYDVPSVVFMTLTPISSCLLRAVCRRAHSAPTTLRP